MNESMIHLSTLGKSIWKAHKGGMTIWEFRNAIEAQLQQQTATLQAEYDIFEAKRLQANKELKKYYYTYALENLSFVLLRALIQENESLQEPLRFSEPKLFKFIQERENLLFCMTMLKHHEYINEIHSRAHALTLEPNQTRASKLLGELQEKVLIETNTRKEKYDLSKEKRGIRSTQAYTEAANDLNTLIRSRCIELTDRYKETKADVGFLQPSLDFMTELLANVQKNEAINEQGELAQAFIGKLFFTLKNENQQLYQFWTDPALPLTPSSFASSTSAAPN